MYCTIAIVNLGVYGTLKVEEPWAGFPGIFLLVETLFEMDLSK